MATLYYSFQLKKQIKRSKKSVSVKPEKRQKSIGEAVVANSGQSEEPLTLPEGFVDEGDEIRNGEGAPPEENGPSLTL